MEEEYFGTYYYLNVKFEICIIRTDFVKENLFCFGDFQESYENNNLIFNYAMNLIKDMGYEQDFTFISTGDMYGESYHNILGKYIKIKGRDGKPNYDFYDWKNKLYYVYGNHDLEINNSNIVELNGIKILNSGETIYGIHWIKSKDNKYPSKYSNYDNYIKKIKEKIDILVTHDVPEIDNNNGNPLLTSIKSKIHIFGHLHFDFPYLFRDKLYINTDSRFIILIPK